MKTTTTIQSNSIRSMFPLVDHETQAMMELGRKQDWQFSILGKAPLPNQPVRLGDWLIIPAHQDSSLIPARALERIQAIYAYGLRPKGFVLVHEAPLQLSMPEVEVDEVPEIETSQFNTKYIWIAVGVLILGWVILPKILALVAAALTAVAGFAVPAAVIVGAAIVDPILVAVTKDGHWVEIDRWDS